MERERIARLVRRMKNTAWQMIEGPIESPRRLLDYALTRREVDGPLTRVDVRRNLSREEFVENYLSKNKPVIVEDAMDDWAARNWTLDSFERDFGDNTVTLQSPEFAGTSISTLRDFIQKVRSYEHVPVEELPAPMQLPYARNVMASEGKDFTTAAFERLALDWKRPYFLPVGGYVFPRQMFCSLPNYKVYPQFGFYISPRGAATALHVDSHLTNAVLGQIYGEKKIYLFTPDQTPRLPRYQERPPVNLLRGEQPNFNGERPVELTLKPGQMIFIPKYHWHEVYTLSGAISITYNFVHASDMTRAWVRDAYRYERGQRSAFV
jgi:hypothetical protein